MNVDKRERNPHIDKQKQLKKGQEIAFLSILLILALTVVKAFVGLRFDSPLLVADAWHSTADILINLSSLVGLKLASTKKSTKFPYGLYRAETLACLLIGFLIVYIGIELFKDGWFKLFVMNPEKAFPVFPLAASLASCAVAALLAVKQRAIGKAIGSQALLATAKEAFFDIFTSLFVFFGIIFVYANIPYVQGSIIILIAILIVKLGIETAWKAILILMDADMDTQLKLKIHETLNTINGITDVSGVKIRQSGPFKIVNCIIKTTPSLALYKSHDLADTAENMLLDQYNSIESVFIHVEPETERATIAAIPVQDKKGLESMLHPYFGRAPWFMIVDLDADPITEVSYVENDFLEKKGHVGLNAVKSIVDSKINLLFVAGMGEIAFHYLKNHYVDIISVDTEMTVKQIVCLYRENKLFPLDKPGSSKRNF